MRGRQGALGSAPAPRLETMVLEMTFGQELEAARRAAQRAGDAALRYWAAGITAETKPDDSPVTIADREAEKLIARALYEAFPEDGLLGEEGGLRESRSGRRWIIDPIDGTRDFLRGSPVWAVLIGLEQDHDVVAGVAHFAATGETFLAARGGGAFRNDARIQVSGLADPAQSVMCVNALNELPRMPFAPRLPELLARFWAVRSMGGCRDAVMVASGMADAWIEPSAKPWDLAPLKVIVEEAGGRFFNFDGGASIHGGNCICCTPGLEGELRRFLGLE